MKGLLLAVGFLTVMPVKTSGSMEAGDLGRAAMWFPLVGLGIGAALWLVQRLIGPHLPALGAAGLLLSLWVMATGGLHLDGFADCCDGFFAPTAPGRRLEIMSDSRAGAFALVGVSLLLLLKFSAVAGLADPRGLLLAPVFGRWWMLPLAKTTPARDQGMGALLHSELSWWRILPAAVLVAALAALAGRRAWLGLLATGAATLALGQLAKSRLGGQTGDVLGANCEVVEWIALLTYLWN